MTIKKLCLVIFSSALFFGTSNLNAGCREDCEASGQGIANATGCIQCGELHTAFCIQFECLAE